jgi:hypothetical protein
MRIPQLASVLLLTFVTCAFAQSAEKQLAGQPATAPPINLTVTAPERSATEIARDEQRRAEDLALRRQQNAFNQQIANYTRIQTGVVVISLVLSVAALWIANSQAAIALASKRNMDRQTEHMKGQLVATQKSADAAVLAVEHADRPWIRVQIEKPSLKWSDTEGVEITATVILHNIGRSVAEQVRIEVDYVPDSGLEAVKQQAELADSAREPRLLHLATTLFPDERKEVTYGVGTGRDRTCDYWKKMMPQMLDLDLDKRILSAKYIGCVAYRYGTSEKWHYTFWGYDVVSSKRGHLVMEIATGKTTEQPFLIEAFTGNWNRAT